MSLKHIKKATISGNTYPVKDKIKQLGGRWDAQNKVWIIDIAGHPSNTMRGRGQLEYEINQLQYVGCKVKFE